MTSLLSSILSGRPDATVGAVDGAGVPAELPRGVELPSGQHLDGRSTLDVVVPQDVGLVADAFVDALTRGAGSATIHLAADPGRAYRLEYLDVRSELGVVLRLVSPLPGDGAEPAPAPVSSFAPAKPRLATLTRDEAGVILSADNAATEMLGWREEDLVGSSTLDFVHPDDQAKAVENWMARLRRTSGSQTRTRAVRLRYRCKDGTWIWVETSNDFEQQPDGTTVVHAQLLDVSDEMAALDSLRKSEQETAKALALLDSVESSAPVGIAFLDTDLRFVRVNDMFCTLTDRVRDDYVGRTPAEISPRAWSEFGVVGKELAYKREPLVNVEIDRRMLDDARRPITLLASSYPVEVEGELEGFGLIIVDISERKEAEERQRALAHAAINALATTVERRDLYTAGHQRGVAQLAAAMARELGIDEFEVEGITMAATIHDIGKIAIPADILAKPARLTDLEMEMVKTHSRVGYEIMAGFELPWPVAEMILQHHERMDGSGYPAGLRGEGILFGARIIAVADVVEAMAAHRPYRPAPGLDEALELIASGRGRLYDDDAAGACLRLFREERFAFG